MNSACDSLWFNVNLATMVAGKIEYGIINDAAIASCDGVITWVGPQDILPETIKASATITHDMRGKWLTPGLIDCHTHIIYGGDRAHEFELRLQGASYEELTRMGAGIFSTVRATRAASEKELFESARRRISNLTHEGVTTVEIKSGYGLDTDTELRMLQTARKINDLLPELDVVTTFLGAHALPQEFSTKRQAYIDFLIKEMLPVIAKDGLADAVDGFCENIAFSPDEIKTIFEKSKELGLPVKLHADQLSDLGGATLAADYRALSADHLEYTSEAGVVAMAEAGTVAVLLPGAFYSLRETKLPPVDLFRQNKVPIAIATDSNPGSAPVVSLLLMVNMACVLFSLTPEEALAGVTRCAAQALGQLHKKGTLEVGKKADFAVWDIKHPRELAYFIGARPCVAVVKDGREYPL